MIRNLKLDPSSNRALKMLFFTGFRGYLVGGTVRDLLLERKPKDIDICTNALPQNILDTFALYKTNTIGIKHGTIRVFIHSVPVDISTYRIDGNYSDARHPDQVIFTEDLRIDLARRDFTINAMAYNQPIGLIDDYHGVKDLKNKMIRCVGNPSVRFKEDALRIMRALRFASVLNFEIEIETKKALLENKNLLKKISNASISKEFIKLLKGVNCEKVIIEFFEVFCVILPELENFTDQEILTIGHAVSMMPSHPHMRLAAFFHCLNEETVSDILKRLNFNNTTIVATCLLIRNLSIKVTPDTKTIKTYLRKLDLEVFDQILTLKQACLLSKNVDAYEQLVEQKNLEFARELVKEIAENHGCYSIKELQINGNELVELGIKPGPEVGNILEKILDLIIEGKLENKKEDLIKYIKKYY